MKLRDFIKPLNISEKEFRQSGLSISELNTIKKDYIEYSEDFRKHAINLADSLMKIKRVHSVKFRIKDPDHLISKIIRKKNESPQLKFDSGNYKNKIRDLVGIRILHLFKDDWAGLHNSIIKKFQLALKPIAYIREGDTPSIITSYKKKGCVVKLHPKGYRSVHYSLKNKIHNKVYYNELQVRTLFEEGWSEIDHIMRYGSYDGNPFIPLYLELFNRAAGNADEMGSFILHLKNITKKFKSENLKNRELINALRKQIGNLNITEDKKKDLKEKITEISPFQEGAVVDYLTRSPFIGSKG